MISDLSKTAEELAEEYAMFGKNDMPDSVLKRQKIAEQKFDFLAGYQAATPKWISVKDRLPERNQLCLVDTEWRGVVVAQYGWESWVFDEGQGYSEKPLSYAPHWMPLPESPKAV
jgi:Protein of unknown function (DUF551)